MTRAAAKSYLRRIGSILLEHAILQELDLGVRIEDCAESVLESGSEFDADEVGFWLEMRRESVEKDLAGGRRFDVRTEDLVDLLSSDTAAVRLLAIRLLRGRDDAS